MRAKNLLLVVVSTLVGLLLWEAGLRWFTDYGPHHAAQPASVAAKPLGSLPAARRFPPAGTSSSDRSRGAGKGMDRLCTACAGHPPPD